MTYSITGGTVGDPDLPTREQVQEWLDSLPTCSAGVINCVRKHKVENPREHIVEEVCYSTPELIHSGCD